MIQRTMDGKLYQIKDKNNFDDDFGIYWCERYDLDEDALADEFKKWEDSDAYDETEFEEWWNERYPDIYIHRVFLEEVYI